MAIKIADSASSSNKVNTADSPFDISGELTLCCWIKPTSLPNGQLFMFFKQDFGGAAGYSFFILGNSDALYATLNGNNKTVAGTTNGVVVDVWQFVAMVYKPSTSVKFYRRRLEDVALTLDTNDT